MPVNQENLMNHNKYKFVLAFFTAVFSTTVSADVHIENSGGFDGILVDGIISSSDYPTLVDKINLISKKDPSAPISIILNSNGGDLDSAIKMGKFLRAEKGYLHAFVPKGAVCASSCVFVLAGAKYKTTTGQVFIHRPFVDDDSVVTASKQKIRYKKVEKIVKNYLEEMNIPLTLWDEMITVSSSDARLLSPLEIKKYRLDGTDIYQDEAMSSIRAKELGITKSELSLRYSRLERICINESIEFQRAIDARLSETEAESIIRDYENCRNEVMQGIRK